jgi:hypothetical protein
VGPKIDRRDLGEIVQETARQHAGDEASTIDRSDAQQILRELDLPAENIDETHQVVIMRRRELAARRRRRLTGGGLLLAGVLTAGGVAVHTHHRSQAMEQITGAQSALTVQGAGVRGPVVRGGAPELVFEVTLARAPQDARVALSCEWAGPDGGVRHRNQWSTRPVDHALWPTHCRHQFGAADPAGSWTVTMRQSARVLATERFVLE